MIRYLALALMLGGCATPATYTSAPMKAYDKDTSYSVEEAPGGFVVTVEYSRYQFIPESGAVQTSCRQQLTSIAHEEAKRRGRALAPVNEQQMKISMGRNGFTGITSCSASVPAVFMALGSSGLSLIHADRIEAAMQRELAAERESRSATVP